ncbi:hypothetical protein [Rhizobium gallicum]|nr:hypothetical protein [Rhizobium gallicum]
MKNFATILMVATLFAAMILVFAAISSSGLRFELNSNAVLTLLFFATALGVMIASIFIRSFSLVDLLVMYFVAVSVGFSGFYEVATNAFPWPVVHDGTSIRYALIVYSLFLAAYLVGHFSAGAIPVPKIHAINSNRRYSTAMLTMLCLTLVCLAIAGPSAFSPRAADDAVIAEGIRPQILQIGKSLCLTAWLFLLCSWLDKRRYAGLVISAGFMMLICFNPITSPRFQFIAAVLATLSTLAIFTNPAPVVKASVYCALFLANYIVFGPLKSLSAGISNFDTWAFNDLGSFLADYAYRVDFDAMQVSANTLAYFDANGGFSFGYNLLGAVLFWVPRMFWPNKPMSESIEIHDSLGYEYTNLSFPLPMELYACAGLVSVVVLAFFFAFFIKRISLKTAAAQHFYSIRIEQTVLMALLAGYMPIIMRGALNAVAPFFGFSFAAYVIIVILNRSFFRAARQSFHL